MYQYWKGQYLSLITARCSTTHAISLCAARLVYTTAPASFQLKVCDTLKSFLHHFFTKNLRDTSMDRESFFCPITGTVMEDPVVDPGVISSSLKALSFSTHNNTPTPIHQTRLLQHMNALNNIYYRGQLFWERSNRELVKEESNIPHYSCPFVHSSTDSK